MNVKSSKVAELQVQPVSEGDNVTIKCDQQAAKGSKNGLVWYWQSIGKVPQYIVRMFEYNNKHRFAREFENGRFTMTVDEERFDLNIYGVSWKDTGTYFCGKGKSNVVKFGSGTLLVFEGSYQLKYGSEEFNPEINETQGSRNDQCVRPSETDSPTQSCVCKLPKRNLSLSDAGTHYCAVVPCEETYFGNGCMEIKGDDCTQQLHMLFCFSILRSVILVVLVEQGLGVEEGEDGGTHKHHHQQMMQRTSETVQSDHEKCIAVTSECVKKGLPRQLHVWLQHFDQPVTGGEGHPKFGSPQVMVPRIKNLLPGGSVVCVERGFMLSGRFVLVGHPLVKSNIGSHHW
ncbi:hypothetical protein AOLI_G00111420 [Acnodon oligacanthus]